MSDVILKVENLVKHFPTGKGKRGEKEVVKAVDGISFELKAGETLGLVDQWLPHRQGVEPEAARGGGDETGEVADPRAIH